MPALPCAVAIPARNEADRIPDCLEALANQVGPRLDHVVLFVNNTTDATIARARQVHLPASTTLHVIEANLPPHQANPGHARRLAMDHAATLVPPRGILLTTDADGRVDADWLAANLDAIEAGADAVAGWIELFPADWGAIPTRLHEDDARECAYDALCDEIHAILDPDPADPFPRHTQNAGASIAVTLEAYTRCGGVPLVPSGEDRALIAALRRVDARIRHAPEVHVQVSGRIDGRCEGGMADTIRRRLSAPDTFIDDRLEPAAACAARATFRAELRRAYGSTPAPDLAPRLHLPPSRLHQHLRLPHFGLAWEAVEQESPALRRHPVPVTELATETASAAAILARLRSPTPEPSLTPTTTAYRPTSLPLPLN